VRGAVQVAEGVDRRLRELAEQLDSYGWAAELLDHEWRLVWVSDELLAMYGERDPERLGIGDHIGVFRARGLAQGVTTEDSAERWARTNGPFILDAAENDKEALAEMLGPAWAGLLKSLEPRPAPALWTSAVDFSRDEFFGRVNYVGVRVHDADGELLGYLFLYGLDVPASIAALLVRGDRAMHERMAALVQPGQRSAAVLFADLEASGSLSRQLPSPIYFRLVSDIRTALEAAVANCSGIVGKHAGDGVTAYFLSEQLESASRAARAALETARGLPQLAREAATRLADEGLPVDPERCRVKVAVHWGPSLYVGQVASQGRLEITALGDEMNEAARIEQSAEGGQVLASKPVLERLDEEDASALRLDPARVAYRALADIEGVTEKAKRDAGSIAVADVSEMSLRT
jgi:class 3 adenylate cyclase